MQRECPYQSQGSTKYYSLAVQVDGSLREGAGSLLMLLLLGSSSSLLSCRRCKNNSLTDRVRVARAR